MDYDHNALDTVHLIQVAQQRVATWDLNLQSQVLVATPREFMEHGAQAWLTTVALIASPDEHPVYATQRLTKYLLAYQETYGRIPSLASVQKHAADRHLKEPR